MPAPKGNTHSAKDREFRRAIAKKLELLDEKAKMHRGHTLECIAGKAIELALDGNLNAITEIANRLDGKPQQSVDITQETFVTLTDADLDRRIHDLARQVGIAAAIAGTETTH